MIYDIFHVTRPNSPCANYEADSEEKALDQFHRDEGFINYEDYYAKARPYEGPWSVAVYKVDKAFGGPEEGGWWYTAGELVLDNDFPLPSFHKTEAEADAAYDDMSKALEPHNAGRRSISSILSDGVYRAMVWEGMPPQHFPKVTPHYE